MSRIYTYPRGLYRGYTAYIVLRLPCCCSGHNIIPTTHQRNEPFIAALLGCCFLSQANTTTSSSSLNRRPRSWHSRLLPFRASLFLLLAAHRAHTHTHYPRCVTLRYVAYTCHVGARVASLHLRPELRSLRVACHENFVGIPFAVANYRCDVPQGRS